MHALIDPAGNISVFTQRDMPTLYARLIVIEQVAEHDKLSGVASLLLTIH